MKLIVILALSTSETPQTTTRGLGKFVSNDGTTAAKSKEASAKR